MPHQWLCWGDQTDRSKRPVNILLPAVSKVTATMIAFLGCTHLIG